MPNKTLADCQEYIKKYEPDGDGFLTNTGTFNYIQLLYSTICAQELLSSSYQDFESF